MQFFFFRLEEDVGLCGFEVSDLLIITEGIAKLRYCIGTKMHQPPLKNPIVHNPQE